MDANTVHNVYVWRYWLVARCIRCLNVVRVGSMGWLIEVTI